MQDLQLRMEDPNDQARPEEVEIELPEPTKQWTRLQRNLKDRLPAGQTTVLIKSNAYLGIENQWCIEAALAHVLALPAGTPCEHCSLGIGKRPFVDCAVLDRVFGGACTNCKAAHGQSFCTFRNGGLITESAIIQKNGCNNVQPKLRNRAIEMGPEVYGKWLETLPGTVTFECIMYAEEVLRRFAKQDLVVLSYIEQKREQVEYEPALQAQLVTSCQHNVDLMSQSNVQNHQTLDDEETPDTTRYLQAAAHMDQIMNALVQERRESWDLCKSHPVFLYLVRYKHEQVKQALRAFFDRRYTGLVALAIRADGVLEALKKMTVGNEMLLLRLRDDGEFGYMKAMLNRLSKGVGDGDEPWSLHRINVSVWEQLMAQARHNKG